MDEPLYTSWTLAIAADAADGALLAGCAGRGVAKAVLDTVTRDAAGDGRMALATIAPPRRSQPQSATKRVDDLDRLCSEQQEYIRVLAADRDALRRAACDILNPDGPTDAHARLAALVIPKDGA
jgi:hypothetical protein